MRFGRHGLERLKKYKRGDAFSYTLGAFPTFELLEAAPERAESILFHPDYDGKEKLIALAEKQKVPVFEDKKTIERLSDKGNCFVAGVFKTEYTPVLSERRHVLLVNPSDMGNLGTIIRTSAGFDGTDVAMIAPCADPNDPKTVRASMGAVFRVRVAVFDSIEAYLYAYPGRKLYPFMLKGSVPLGEAEKPEGDYTLVFGNEATGLPDRYADMGEALRIPMGNKVDSYNLACSVAMGLYAFSELVK